MSNNASITTWGVLKDFGFKPDPDSELISDILPVLSFDFGGFKLSASCVTNMRLAEVVLFTGLLATERILADVSFEMPRTVTSREQCAAWIVSHLDAYMNEEILRPARNIGWVIEGRINQSQLPWNIELAAYEARPCCTVTRDWFKLALKELKEILSMSGDDTPVEFSFSDSVLTIRCDGKAVALPGKGEPWPKHYTIPAGKIRILPKRLMRGVIEVSVSEPYLTIGRWRYTGVVGKTDISNTKTAGN